jgi:hypothetical protein
MLAGENEHTRVVPSVEGGSDLLLLTFATAQFASGLTAASSVSHPIDAERARC